MDVPAPLQASPHLLTMCASTSSLFENNLTISRQNIQGSSRSLLTPALGFASNLSYTIIRETQEDDDRSERSDDSADTTISITDEELALLGPPWAKEGMLCRKQYNETAGKRARSKAWMDVFVVIQKGELNMFTFGNHVIDGQRVVGGGNWLVCSFIYHTRPGRN